MHQLAEQLQSLTQMFGSDFFDHMQNGFKPVKSPPQNGSGSPATTGEAPPIELYVTTDEVVLHAVLPGLQSPSQVSVSLVTPSQVVLDAFLTPPQAGLGMLVQRERFSGYCTRAVTLPVSVQPVSAKSHYEDGILELRFLRTEPGRGGEGVALLHVPAPGVPVPP